LIRHPVIIAPIGVQRQVLLTERLLTNRTDLISSMQSVKDGVIAEVGVGIGNFSEYLLNELRPKEFVAFDIFTMHKPARLGGGPWRGISKPNIPFRKYDPS
jgi:hypothetical protein